MIEAAIKPISGGSPSQQAVVRVEPPEKLATLAKGKDAVASGETFNNPDSIGMNLNMESMEKLQQEFNKLFARQDSVYQYQMDKETKRVVFRELDKKTGEVLRQIPPEELLSFAHKLMELMDGNILNVKA